MKLQGKRFKTEFTEDGKWRCPICESKVKQIRKHLLTNHQDEVPVQDWESIEEYLKTITLLKRKETYRKRDAKRDSNPERKEAKRQTMKKVDAKRAGKPERKEVLQRADAKRADKPERKEAKKLSDARLAGKPERKEVQKKAKKKYLLTPKGLFAKLQENQRQRDFQMPN